MKGSLHSDIGVKSEGGEHDEETIPLHFDHRSDENKDRSNFPKEDLEYMLNLLGDGPPQKSLLSGEGPHKSEKTGKKNNRLTAVEIFLKFVRRFEDENGKVIVDVSEILSRKCYVMWLNNRMKSISHPEESFRKSILAHLTCADKSSSPFPGDVEIALLQRLRFTEVWPCFEGQFHADGKPVLIGTKGIRCLGYREKEGQTSTSSPQHKRKSMPSYTEERTTKSSHVGSRYINPE